MRFAFAHVAPLLPVRRIVETPTVIAFHHPRPSYPVHVLVVPKRAISSLLDLDSTELSLVVEVVRAARQVAARLGLDSASLIVNGGAYQDVGQLHFHLLAGDEGYTCPETAPPAPLRDGPVEAFAHPRPRRAAHWAIRPFDGADPDAVLPALYRLAQRLAREQDLAAGGFSVVLAGPGLRPDCLHLVAGGRFDAAGSTHVTRPKTPERRDQMR